MRIITEKPYFPRAKNCADKSFEDKKKKKAFCKHKKDSYINKKTSASYNKFKQFSDFMFYLNICVLFSPKKWAYLHTNIKKSLKVIKKNRNVSKLEI